LKTTHLATLLRNDACVGGEQEKLISGEAISTAISTGRPDGFVKKIDKMLPDPIFCQN
jgi:hypothetical protein